MAKSISRRSLASLAAAAAAGVGPAAGAWAEDAWLVTQLAELTGPLALVGDAWRNGVEMAAQEINAAGGLLGRMIQVVTFDTQSNPAGAHAAMVKALEGDPLAVLGPAVSDTARAALAVPRGGRALLLGATAGDLTGPAHPCVFRTVPSETVMMTRLAGWLHGDGGAGRLAVLAAAHEPYRDQGEALAKAARAAGLTLAAEATATADAFADSARLLRATPDTLAILLPPEPAGRVAAEALRQAPHLALIGGTSLVAAKAVETAGAAAERLRGHVLLADDPDVAELAAFRQRFLARTREPASVPALAGYAALAAVRMAVHHLGAADPHALCAALSALKPQDAPARLVLGEAGFDSQGEVARPSWIVEIRGGRPAIVKRLPA